MIEPMTDREIAEIRARCDRATPPPWEWRRFTLAGSNWVRLIGCAKKNEDVEVVTFRGGCPLTDDDAAFIGYARSALPRLLDEVERLREADAEWHFSGWPGDYITIAVAEKWLRERLAEKRIDLVLHRDGWWYAVREMGESVATVLCAGQWTRARAPDRFKTYGECQVAAAEAETMGGEEPPIDSKRTCPRCGYRWNAMAANTTECQKCRAAEAVKGEPE